MGKREDLQKLLENVLGSRNVYYQPPSNITMKYPAIVFSRDRIDNRFANDDVYGQSFGYLVTVIDRDPDSKIVQRLSVLPYCRFNRHFVSDNLNHNVFTIYF